MFLKTLSFVFFMLFVATALPAGYKYVLHRAKFAGAAPPVKIRKRLKRAWLFLALFALTLVIKILGAPKEAPAAPAVPVDRPVESVKDGETDPVSEEVPANDVEDDDDAEKGESRKKGKKKREDD